ncbi:hypothetical protein FAZ69_23760 [Trinickia terrae]|uniref:Lipoprotein n=1 Tax=Trinickia terrae TaxID=2571161 RepID=A0A4U1HWZ5_9BURK|nr:hypothetical protein [Trinickia terrae]TKC83506.1 hypothetical protein FAZ69_23760 [Trinickia terrae]
MKRVLLIMLLPAWLVGCSSSGEISPDTMQTATEPLTCQVPSECAQWWTRAREWVARHANYAMQASTDSLIQTAGPAGGSRALAYQITLTLNHDGTATIGFAAHCDSAFGCNPNPWQAGADFKLYVRSGSAAPARAPAAPGSFAPPRLRTGISQQSAAPRPSLSVPSPDRRPCAAS